MDQSGLLPTVFFCRHTNEKVYDSVQSKNGIGNSSLLNLASAHHQHRKQVKLIHGDVGNNTQSPKYNKICDTTENGVEITDLKFRMEHYNIAVKGLLSVLLI